MSSVPIAWNHRAVGAWAIASRSTWLFPSLLSAIVSLAYLGVRPLDGHEVLVAQTAREMLQTGDWIHPTFNGEARLQKPPLAYWMLAGASRLTGREVSPTLARLPSALSAILLTVATALLASHCFGDSIGRCAGCLQAMSVWSVTGGRSALVDMSLALFVFLAIATSIVDRFKAGVSEKASVLFFWFFLGLASLAKGPVALVFVLPTVLVYRVHCRRMARGRIDRRFLTSAWNGPGLLLFMGIVCWWPTMILMNDPQALALWYDQSIGRFVSRWGEQTRPWHYYFYQVPWLTFPSSAIFLWGVTTWRGGILPIARPEVMLLLCWFLVPFLALSISEGKRDHYILPALPPMAMLTGAVCHRCLPSITRKNGFERALFLWMLVGWIAVVGIIIPRFDACVPWQSMIDRRRAELLAGASVVQWRCHDHSTRFMLDRPMIWADDAKVLSETCRSPGVVIVTTGQALPSIPTNIVYEVLDRSGFAPWTRPHPKRELILLRVKQVD